MQRDFADAILLSSDVFSPLGAFRMARKLHILPTKHPYLRAVPGGWLATIGSGGCLLAPDGKPNYTFSPFRKGIQVGFIIQEDNNDD